MSRPAAKGWCPGAYRPMMSGDGLVVRIRPVFGRMTRDQVIGLCDLSQRFGSGVIDLTSRANVQIRGVSEPDHETLLEALTALDLLPDDPDLEARRNILLPFDWRAGDASHVIAQNLMARLLELPNLPAKFGVAIDAGPAPILTKASADIRVEAAETGLILRADGAATGRPVTVDSAVDATIDLAKWFAGHATGELRRMKSLLATQELASDWQQVAPLATRIKDTPGPHAFGQIFGAPFGQIDANALRNLIETSGSTALRTTPWRLFLLEDAVPCETSVFITSADDPRLTVDACPGAPMCQSASVQTRDLAASLAGMTNKRIHISGCSKGCARARPSDLTLVGRDGMFDLVKDGHAWDAPTLTGLSPDDLKTRIGEF
ncbi:MAG: precorrin-3B synthase [Donghicola eburneus]|nr:precorrin-3B synthase [Donghicola eburneus]MCI5042905.1 precorrin-3B synthase [Donghicola eburneus]